MQGVLDAVMYLCVPATWNITCRSDQDGVIGEPFAEPAWQRNVDGSGYAAGPARAVTAASPRLLLINNVVVIAA